MRKEIKYIIGLVIAGIIGSNSVYFQALDEKLAEDKDLGFDAASFVEGIWENELFKAYDSSIDLNILLEQLKQNPELTFKQEARALGIGNIGYFKVKGIGEVLSINENNIILKTGELSIEIETEFVFGNAIRDASGLIKLEDYDKTADFNSISEAINDKIRAEVIPDFREKVEVGNSLRFTGALELNKVHLDLTQLEIIPLSLQINS